MVVDSRISVKVVKSAGKFLVCLPKSLLLECGVDINQALEVKRYPTKDKTVILRFKGCS